ASTRRMPRARSTWRRSPMRRCTSKGTTPPPRLRHSSRAPVRRRRITTTCRKGNYAMPHHITQQTLKYEHHEDTIVVLARAIDLIGQRRTSEALTVLMDFRNQLQDAQKPKVVDFDPWAELRRASGQQS